MTNNSPVARIKDGTLSLSIFENVASDGKTRFSSPGLTRSYYDEEAQAWKETSSLSGSEYLRAALMLQKAYQKELELKAAAKAAANDGAAPKTAAG